MAFATLGMMMSLASFADTNTAPACTWLPATAKKLPRWRGFNLLEKFKQNSNKPFIEDDFKLISSLGFNFVRLPMDYRCWINNGDWTNINESVLKEIDQAIGYGTTYGIHVSLNFHRAPGYTVSQPAEPRSLWTDAEAQRVCALHWAMFAKRYRGIPNERLSFNLLNEPANVDREAHARVVTMLVKAIRAEDPDRLIIADGITYGIHPCPELVSLGIAQATRGYQPFELTHYMASWAEGTDKFPVPTWPTPMVSAYLYSPSKPDLRSPFRITGPMPKGTRVRLRINKVSAGASLVVHGDGAPVWSHEFVCGPGTGEYTISEFQKQWNMYVCTFDRDYILTLPTAIRELAIAVTNGDWLTMTEVGISVGGTAPERVLGLAGEWGQKQQPITFSPDDTAAPFRTAKELDRAWLRETYVAEWFPVEKQGVGIMVGEFGAFNRTPHDVALRWMRDSLANWKEAGWGWALWNFRGTFGILDSNRKDVAYEDFHGHKLDRKMLELLQQY